MKIFFGAFGNKGILNRSHFVSYWWFQVISSLKMLKTFYVAESGSQKNYFIFLWDFLFPKNILLFITHICFPVTFIQLLCSISCISRWFLLADHVLALCEIKRLITYYVAVAFLCGGHRFLSSLLLFVSHARWQQ